MSLSAATKHALCACFIVQSPNEAEEWTASLSTQTAVIFSLQSRWHVDLPPMSSALKCVSTASTGQGSVVHLLLMIAAKVQNAIWNHATERFKIPSWKSSKNAVPRGKLKGWISKQQLISNEEANRQMRKEEPKIAKKCSVSFFWKNWNSLSSVCAKNMEHIEPHHCPCQKVSDAGKS